MDRIYVKELRGRCILGVTDEERRAKQEVIINITLGADLHLPGRTDRFEDAIDYREIKYRILEAVENSQFRLVEALAQAVAEICLEYPGVAQVTVEVEKPSALRFARSVSAEITRNRV